MEKMVEEEYQDNYYFAEINTRLSDLEGRNNSLKDRTVFLGKNIIKMKEKTDLEIDSIKKDVTELKKGFRELKKIMENLSEDLGKNVRRDEMALVERMLKDFQPLEFMREKDVIELIEQKINKPEKVNKTRKEGE